MLFGNDRFLVNDPIRSAEGRGKEIPVESIFLADIPIDIYLEKKFKCSYSIYFQKD